MHVYKKAVSKSYEDEYQYIYKVLSSKCIYTLSLAIVYRWRDDLDCKYIGLWLSYFG